MVTRTVFLQSCNLYPPIRCVFTKHLIKIKLFWDVQSGPTSREASNLPEILICPAHLSMRFLWMLPGKLASGSDNLTGCVESSAHHLRTVSWVKADMIFNMDQHRVLRQYSCFWFDGFQPCLSACYSEPLHHWDLQQSLKTPTKKFRHRTALFCYRHTCRKNVCIPTREKQIRLLTWLFVDNISCWTAAQHAWLTVHSDRAGSDWSLLMEVITWIICNLIGPWIWLFV